MQERGRRGPCHLGRQPAGRPGTDAAHPRPAADAAPAELVRRSAGRLPPRRARRGLHHRARGGWLAGARRARGAHRRHDPLCPPRSCRPLSAPVAGPWASRTPCEKPVSRPATWSTSASKNWSGRVEPAAWASWAAPLTPSTTATWSPPRRPTIQLALDQLLFIPAGRPPHKTGRPIFAGPPPAAHDRAGHRRQAPPSALPRGPGPPRSLLHCRYPRPAPRRMGPRARLFFIDGADSLVDIDTWHQPQQFFELCHLAVVKRPGITWTWLRLKPSFLA